MIDKTKSASLVMLGLRHNHMRSTFSPTPLTPVQFLQFLLDTVPDSDAEAGGRDISPVHDGAVSGQGLTRRDAGATLLSMSCMPRSGTALLLS